MGLGMFWTIKSLKNKRNPLFYSCSRICFQRPVFELCKIWIKKEKMNSLQVQKSETSSKFPLNLKTQWPVTITGYLQGRKRAQILKLENCLLIIARKVPNHLPCGYSPQSIGPVAHRLWLYPKLRLMSKVWKIKFAFVQMLKFIPLLSRIDISFKEVVRA